MKPSALLGALKAFDLILIMVAAILFIAKRVHFIPVVAAFYGLELDYPDAMRAPVSIHSLYELLTLRLELIDVLLLVAFGLFWYGLFSTFGLYAPSCLLRTSGHVPATFTKIVGCTVVFVSAAALLKYLPSSLAEPLILAAIVACGLSIAVRRVARNVIHRRRRSLNSLRHVIIVGTNARAIALAERLDSGLHGRCHLVGFVDQEWQGNEQLRRGGHSIVSDFNGFQEYLRDRVVDEVIICTPLKSLYEWSSQIFAQCDQQGIRILYGADLFTPRVGHLHAEQLGDQSMLMSDGSPQTGVEAFLKRSADICIATLAVLALAPVMVAVAIAVKLSSPGPALFIQERVGLNKRRFRLYKFRTMVTDAEQRLAGLECLNEVSGPVFKIAKDPRITRVGRVLRKSSLDELPQLFNVLKGDMSLVGPRPLAVRDYRGITEDWQRRRLSVKPGITCLWQVKGRSSIPFEQWMQLDLEYIDRWSLMLDLRILILTIPAVLKGTGAS